MKRQDTSLVKFGARLRDIRKRSRAPSDGSGSDSNSVFSDSDFDFDWEEEFKDEIVEFDKDQLE